MSHVEGRRKEDLIGSLFAPPNRMISDPHQVAAESQFALATSMQGTWSVSFTNESVRFRFARLSLRN
jgi:hypothetical protein